MLQRAVELSQIQDPFPFLSVRWVVVSEEKIEEIVIQLYTA